MALTGRPDDGEAFEAVREWATMWCDRWALDGDRDRFEFKGIGLRSAMRVEVFAALLSVGLRSQGLASDADRRGLGPTLKRMGRDRAARSWALRVRHRPMREGREPVDVAIVSEMATPSALLSSAAVARALGGRRVVVIAADPRAASYWKREGVATIPLLLPLRQQRQTLSRASTAIGRAWAAFEAEPPAMTFAGDDLGAPATRALGPIVRNAGPWVPVEREALGRCFGRTRPRVVLLASDQHRIGALAVDVAAELGIPTAVLQHGLPQHAIGYLPVAADVVLTWSEASTEWFVGRGTQPERTAVVGNPALDARITNATSTRDVENTGSTSIVLALAPTIRSVNASILSRCLDAIHGVDGAMLTVKLHPGDGDWRYVQEIVHAHPARMAVTVMHKEPLGPILTGSSIVLLHRSSIALEALSIGKPVVVVTASAPSTADRELSALGLVQAGTVDEIRHEITRLVDPAERSAYLEAMDVVAYAGPLDGASASRAVAVLDRLMRRAEPP